MAAGKALDPLERGVMTRVGTVGEGIRPLRGDISMRAGPRLAVDVTLGVPARVGCCLFVLELGLGGEADALELTQASSLGLEGVLVHVCNRLPRVALLFELPDGVDDVQRGRLLTNGRVGARKHDSNGVGGASG